MFPKNFQKLIGHFSDLPSIGPKMAERLVLFLFKKDKESLNVFAKDLSEFANNIHYCEKCFHISEEDGLCSVCLDKKREQEIVCVVEDPLDVMAIEKTHQFHGLYHVLGGNLSVMSPQQIEKLKINELVARTKNEKLKEIIIATNPTTDGETTALYLARILKPLGVRVTRLARGLPTGGDIEYADEITLSSSLDGRTKL